MKRMKVWRWSLVGMVLVLMLSTLQPGRLMAWSGAAVGLPKISSGAIAPEPAAASLKGDNGQERSGKPFAEWVRNTHQLSGLFTVYRDRAESKVYLEIDPRQLNQNFLCVTTISAGIGEVGLYPGWPLGDFLFQFRRVQDSIQLVIPNLYFRTRPDDPQRRSIEQSFSDSVVARLPILSTHPERGTLLVELSELLLSGQNLTDLSSLMTWLLGGSYTPDTDGAYLADVGVFPLNLEIDAIYGFSGGETLPFFLMALPDRRAFELGVHYSISKLPDASSYRPRLADERVGYFVEAYQDLSQFSQSDPFVRYIQRWRLEPQNPDAAMSPPKQPIVFWIENTVPLEYRDALREGALLWNDAFTAAGFQDAIEVRQMPNDADWDPADIRYNTIRWFTSLDFLGARGDPRVNPLTGEILGADVIIDANGLRFVQNMSGFLAQHPASRGGDRPSTASRPQLCQDGLGPLYRQWLAVSLGVNGGNPTEPSIGMAEPLVPPGWSEENDVCFSTGLSVQAAMGSLSLTLMQNVLPSGETMQQFVHDYLVYLAAHEVGHALGLRHNFRGSTMLSPEELNNQNLTQQTGLTASVMDYIPVNLAPPGTAQGDYFPTLLGPYDRWAIEYGYTPLDGLVPVAEQPELEAIARRAPTPELSYATDEDATDGLNPDAVRWDLSSDSLKYAQWQMENARQLWTKLEQRYPLPGESYSELRDRFDMVLAYYFEQALKITRYVGGQTFNRDRPGDPAARAPFEQVPLDQQQAALQLLQDYIFAADAFQFSPDLIRQLAPSRWWHWGSMPTLFRLDYPVYDSLLLLQSLTLGQLLSSDRLVRMRDAELVYSPEELITLPELFEHLRAMVWTEVLQPADSVQISSLRRGLQRQHLAILTNMTLRNGSALEEATNFADFVIAVQTANPPEDARILARYQLTQLQDEVSHLLRRQREDMDVATQAHLEDVRDRITKTLDAPLQSR
ncbi:MAG: zinc-dependent metalloprotease [Synechococcales bacterium]|nr:zinc-dependent metalloprotease [Synechococcales bacterium]